MSQNYGKPQFSPQIEGKERPVLDSDFDLFKSLLQDKEQWLKNHDLDCVKLAIGDHFENESEESSNNESNNKDNELESNDHLNNGQNALDNLNLGQDDPNFEEETPKPDTWIRDQFRSCVD
jgi:hypothetical protein